MRSSAVRLYVYGVAAAGAQGVVRPLRDPRRRDRHLRLIARVTSCCELEYRNDGEGIDEH
jgi:hypothetical protein